MTFLGVLPTIWKMEQERRERERNRIPETPIPCFHAPREGRGESGLPTDYPAGPPTSISHQVWPCGDVEYHLLWRTPEGLIGYRMLVYPGDLRRTVQP